MKLNDILTNIQSEVDLKKFSQKRKLHIDKQKVNNLNDISKDKKDINIKKFYKNKKLGVSKYINNSTKDLSKWLDDINICGNKFIKIQDNNNTFSDSVIKWNKLKNIEILKAIKFNRFKRLKGNNIKKKKIKFKIPKLNLIKISFRIRKKFIKKIWIAFLIFCCFLIIDKFLVEIFVNNWYQKLVEIKNNPKDIKFIQKQLNDAKFNFIIWDFLFKPFLLIPGENIKNWYHIINWWKSITKLWDNSLQIYEEINYFIQNKWIENIKTSNIVLNLKNELLDINRLLKDSLENYSKVWDLNNKDINKKINELKYYLEKSITYSDFINDNLDIISKMLWQNREKTYLIVFQNNDEIRPSWGFIWSMWFIKIFKWKIKSIELEDVYNLEWKIWEKETQKIKAPEWINKVSERFSLRDSNYYINIERDSQEIKNFLSLAWYNIDWVIYINQNLIFDLLKVSWDIKINSIDENINENNFSEIISTLVEAKVSKEWTLWTPKQILFDFAGEFKNKLINKWNYDDYLKVVLKNFKNREIMINSFDQEEENILDFFKLSWNIDFENTLDFSYPVFTSVWWVKTDRYIKRKFKKDITINDDCSIETNLDIYQSHLFTKTEEEKIIKILSKYNIDDKDKILHIQWRWYNYQYIRLLLPKDAIIEKNENIISENTFDNFKVLDFYLKTERLQTTNINIKYKIENKDCNMYDFNFYKQSWLKDYSIEIKNKSSIIKENNLENDFYYKTN